MLRRCAWIIRRGHILKEAKKPKVTEKPPKKTKQTVFRRIDGVEVIVTSDN